MENEKYLYLLKVYNKETSLIKFGYTNNIKNRMQSYLSANPLTELLHIWKLDKAEEYEKYFHDNNKSEIKNEWYDESLYDKINNYVNDIYLGNIDLNKTSINLYKKESPLDLNCFNFPMNAETFIETLKEHLNKSETYVRQVIKQELKNKKLSTIKKGKYIIYNKL